MPRKRIVAHELRLDTILYGVTRPPAHDVWLHVGRCACKNWEALSDSAIRVRLLFDHEHMHEVMQRVNG